MTKDGIFYGEHEEKVWLREAYWIHKHEVSLEYGGPEEGGWWYTSGVPTGFSCGPFINEEAAYQECRALNELEHERREREEDYDFSSVLSYRSNHYSYTVENYPEPRVFPETRPFYE